MDVVRLLLGARAMDQGAGLQWLQDGDLDELLELGLGGGKTVEKKTVKSTVQHSNHVSSDEEKGDHDSLEAWLDTL